MKDFASVYKTLNTEQKQAVDILDGPLLVLAGPGTGKTQLLSTRVANILNKTDTVAQNILCLTFTESGAQNMRERLTSIIGEQAYDVHISTYHSFGSDIIRAYPQYFTGVRLENGEDARLERPIDELTKSLLVEQILRKLPFDDPLRSATYYVKSVVGTISELKRANISPDTARQLAQQNLTAIEETAHAIQETYGSVGRIPKIALALPLFESLQDVLTAHESLLCKQASTAIQTALQEAYDTQKTSALTNFKNEWLHKNEVANWELTGRDASEKMVSLAHIYEAYQQEIAKKSLYDFDDMILRTIDAMKTKPELLYTLQETYQHILLDEFQDTNQSQFELVKLLADNPVNEGRPNIMAVGDDDQAIYAFQGADIGNMQAFRKAFTNVQVVNLTQNYRSHADILHTAHAVAEQIEVRLHHDLENITKTLIAASTSLPKNAHIERHEFSAEADEYAWIASQIAALVAQGTLPSDIAVLSPKHAKLESLVPFINHHHIPVTYEKRENILQTPLVRMVAEMSRLVIALSEQNQKLASSIMPVVFSFDFWNIAPEIVWRVNWQAARYEEKRSWAEIALGQPELSAHVQFFLKLAGLAHTEPLEYILDDITGAAPVHITDDVVYTCPLKEYYFASSKRQQSERDFYEALSHLSVIRSKLRDYQLGSDILLKLADFLQFITMYEAAEEPLLNSHPLAQAAHSVQLMTVYKAKGLEFSHVFLLNLHDDVWGKKSRSSSSKIALPANLSYIRYQGSSEDELRRLLFVAITRAKQGLYLTSHASSDSGKKTEPVKYLHEYQEVSGRLVGVLPAHAQSVHINTHSSTMPQHAVELLWHHKHTELNPTLEGLLKDRLSTYKMSPTHLNTFIDTEYGGPEAFLLRTLLRFPQAPTPDSEFGNAVHGALDSFQKKIAEGHTPTLKDLLKSFDQELEKRYIPEADMGHFKTKGHHALGAYLQANSAMFYKTSALSEVDFARENVFLESTAHISGKIDRLEVDKKTKTIHVVDFKTGKPASKWVNELKYLKYRQQLYFYKLLLEGSRTYKGYTVVSGRLEFIEPNKQGRAAEPLRIEYNEEEADQLKKLILAVWNRIQTLQFEQSTAYKADYKGASQFIAELLNT